MAQIPPVPQEPTLDSNHDPDPDVESEGEDELSPIASGSDDEENAYGVEGGEAGIGGSEDDLSDLGDPGSSSGARRRRSTRNTRPTERSNGPVVKRRRLSHPNSPSEASSGTGSDSDPQEPVGSRRTSTIGRPSSPATPTTTTQCRLLRPRESAGDPSSSRPSLTGIEAPSRPRIRSQGIFWSSSTRSSFADSGSAQNHDPNLDLPALTRPTPDDPVARTLGVHASLGSGSSLTPIPDRTFAFTFTRSDLVRYRLGKGPKDGAGEAQRETAQEWEGWKGMTIAEGCWRKWEEIGGLPKGLGGLLGSGYDHNGEAYKPEMTHVQAIRLVIAASPRRMMTLAQIYQAIEERWPWHKTAGTTWKNSIRHNLSLNDCFVNTERPMNEGAAGKGGYWIVDDTLSGKTARKLKRFGPDQLASQTQTQAQTQAQAHSRAHSHSHSSSYPYPSPTKSVSGELFTTDHLRGQGAAGPSKSASRGQSPSAIGAQVPQAHPHRQAQAQVQAQLGRAPSTAQPASAKGKGKIAKPATPYPYAIPQRPPNWVPDEVIRSSREIGIARPEHDTPLDRPSISASPTVPPSTSQPGSLLASPTRTHFRIGEGSQARPHATSSTFPLQTAGQSALPSQPTFPYPYPSPYSTLLPSPPTAGAASPPAPLQSGHPAGSLQPGPGGSAAGPDRSVKSAGGPQALPSLMSVLCSTVAPQGDGRGEGGMTLPPVDGASRG